LTSATPTPLNRLRKEWREKRPTFGAIATIPSIQTVQIMARSGIDWIIVDLEHGPIEYQLFGNTDPGVATLVMLHEGLGSVAMWRDFPQKLADSLRLRVLAYSRHGYGQSAPLSAPRAVSYMHDEALITLPQILDATKIRKAILVGHSDGGSIALIHAGGTRDDRVTGLVLEAPHVFVEEAGIKRIKAIVGDYESGDLKRRLERYHGANVDCAFWGWNRVWLDPEFLSWNIEKYLPEIRVPVLVIQGKDDQYGTLRQVEAINNGCQGPVHKVILKDCGHSPHVDQPAETLEAIVKFVSSTAIHPLGAT